MRSVAVGPYTTLVARVCVFAAAKRERERGTYTLDEITVWLFHRERGDHLSKRKSEIATPRSVLPFDHRMPR